MVLIDDILIQVEQVPLNNAATCAFTRDGNSQHFALRRMTVVPHEIEFERSVTNTATGSIAGRDGILRFSSALTNNGKLGFSTGESDVFGSVANTATGTIQVEGEGVVTFYDLVTSSGALTVGPEATAVFLGDFAVAANASVSLLGLAVDPQPNDLPSIVDPKRGLQREAILRVFEEHLHHGDEHVLGAFRLHAAFPG